LSSAFHPAPFQIDHSIAATRGPTELENLALARIRCNRFKSPNIAGVDPDSGEVVRLFHRHRDSRTEHFAWNGPQLKALTQIGRVTIALLLINDPEIMALWKTLQEEGVFGV
jgi:hypothetical protein